ncbi:hypothetical protein DL766_005452 [Monosporascus sp. MC13-8B]|uniref:Uncharacterized protein n=1 Tax=Monosporascus cannonballus TaxID=155416 RepID=A0ABY0HCQ8_9PEZI|nr:hypothetical protein DL762_004237 [Monosporascus cannonballus]RYP00625.1 hypothetical protein DL763_000679 [Monosporascus cannonballus]RYP29303.1 hypothetical protein DL766_005452 [Monosporascus sp. MC13-8B]
MESSSGWTFSADEISLQGLAKTIHSVSRKRVFDALRPGLEADGNPRDRAHGIAEGLEGVCPADSDPSQVEQVLYDLWELLIAVVKVAPPEHQWHEILVGAVENLAARDGRIIQLDEGPKHLWKDLPQFEQSLKEQWTDPTTDPRNFNLDRGKRWESLNSFVARLMSKGLGSYELFALTTMRHALEESVSRKELAECRLRTAMQWIIYSREALFRSIVSPSGNAPAGRNASVGSLYVGGGPGLSRSRWEFWKMRFGEIEKEKEGPLKAKLKEVIAMMEAAEHSPGP